LGSVQGGGESERDVEDGGDRVDAEKGQAAGGCAGAGSDRAAPGVGEAERREVMSGLDLQAILASPGRGPGRPKRDDRELAEERRKEQVRRTNRARNMALLALSKLYPDDFKELYAQANRHVNLQAGPLPGDET
jgi:hypothetical protein